MEGEVTLPIAYHVELQHAFYALVDEARVKEWHEHPYVPRPYTFSRILGLAQVQKRTLQFSGLLRWWLSSNHPELLREVVNHLRQEPKIHLAGQALKVSALEWEPTPVFGTSHIVVQTLSPIVVDDNVNGRIVSYPPDDPRFSGHIARMAQRKAEVFLPSETQQSVTILPKGESKQIKSWFKSTPVIGYVGQFELTGSEKMLQMLYDTGLGRRNGLGFGLVSWMM
jgi:CRISPR-associated endoribonuclease Cas6